MYKDNKVLLEYGPYEKFVEYGPASLTESELLAIILRTGTKDKNAVDVAGDVLKLGKFPRIGLLGLYDSTMEELLAIKGVGPVKAIKLKALTELSMRMHRACAKEGFIASSPRTVADYFMEDMRHLENECVVLACFDSKGQMICHRRLSEGSVNASLVSPRSVFIESLRCNSVYIILLHNHPSGDPSPSDEDIELTNVLEHLGKELGVRLMDHIVIGDNRYFSFNENNLLGSALEA